MPVEHIKKHFENCKTHPHSKRVFEEAFKYFSEDVEKTRQSLSVIYELVIEKKSKTFNKELQVTLKNKETFTTEKLELSQKRFIKKLPPLIEFAGPRDVLEEIWKAKAFEPSFLLYRKIIHNSILNSKQKDFVKTIRFDFVRDKATSFEDSLE